MNNLNNNYSDLTVFGEAKDSAISNFRKLYNLNESLLNLTKIITEQETNLSFSDYESDITESNEKCSRIIKVLERKKMKCAFFGRTSNGKSSVINSMLGQKILPYGIGHTTNCFVEISGTSAFEGYVIKSATQNTDPNCQMDDGSFEKNNLPIKSVHDLSHALSNEKVSSETLISLYWPIKNCDLLQSEVSLLDSPGIDIDPNLDYWISQNCLDADVFVLVANAESTLTSTEKTFFHKVKEKLSNPNIFILNNRWDACDYEEDYVAAAKKQHEQRCIDFLTKELNVCSNIEAMERVFFVSAKEMLEFRTHDSPIRNNDAKILDRYESFLAFERSLKKNLCASALKTKFSSHVLQGLDIVSSTSAMANYIDCQLSAKLKEETARRDCQMKISDRIKKDSPRITENVEKQIEKVVQNILRKVVDRLQSEIKYLNVIVRNFSFPFDPEPGHLLTYKTNLNNFVENEINKRMSSFCAMDVRQELKQFQIFILDEYKVLVDHEVDKSVVEVIDRASEDKLSIPCNSLFSNFKEDLSFHWPFNPRVLISDILLISYTARNQLNSGYLINDRFLSRLGAFGPIGNQFLGIFMNKEVLGFCLMSVLIHKVTGLRLITSAFCSYGLLYVFERFRWSRDIQEKNFKSQYVKYASNQLKNLIDVCTRSYSYVIKQDLHMSHNAMIRFVDNELSCCDVEIVKCDTRISYFRQYLATTESLKSGASVLNSQLLRFKESFL